MSGLVTAVVCAAFDEATDRAVLALRDVVAGTGVRMTARPRHRPHVTLAATRLHRAQVDSLVDLLRPFAADGAVPLVLDHIGTFGRAGALWLGPSDAPDLCRLQRSVHAVLADGPWPNPFGARTDPREWVPHCSLATRLGPATLATARAAVERGFSPLPARVDGLAVVLVGGAGDVGLLPLAGGQPSSWQRQNG